MSIMKNTKLNLDYSISVLSFSLLILSVSAQENATHPVDVAGIILIQSAFPALGVVNSTLTDPCLPTPYSWVTCNSDNIPRVTALNCGSKGLSGILVDFSLMDALEIIDFSNNHLTQHFPDFLAKFPKLKELNLANTKMIGTVPTSLQKNQNLKLTVLPGNPYLCFSDDDSCSSIQLKTVIMFLMIAACVIIIV
ncbi:hypothetical protein C5167_007330 [Papaver somniferum]|uniref:putative leucine-rich repeat receptor-like protein kinase At2g19210 n=1 Tax=Papaver somniferum TaxID=3469 RepID=UPI000E6F750B|nr:putative leucine-rich repeat receptor-like protein kinase At2g19210 [Papaver somniferum]RZC93520.1 hypothetical protein C5167_007330 [Papaver somniferum]